MSEITTYLPIQITVCGKTKDLELEIKATYQPGATYPIGPDGKKNTPDEPSGFVVDSAKLSDVDILPGLTEDQREAIELAVNELLGE